MISRIRKSFSLLTAILFVCLCSTANAQLTAPASSSTSLGVPPISSVPEKSAAQISPEAMIFDGAVNPHEYRMGPGDILQYNSWTSNDSRMLMVSADQLLVIPRIGEFSVKGKTLEQVKDFEMNQ